MIRILDRMSNDYRIVIGGDRFVARFLETVAQMRQRRAQIVSNVARYLPKAIQQRGDAIEHVVDGDGQTVQFIAAAAQRYSVTELSGNNRSAGARNRIYAAHELHAEENPSQSREDDGYRLDPRKCLEDSQTRGRDLPRVATDEQIDP